MAINYPGSLDNGTSLPNPSATNDTNSPSLSSGQSLQNAAVIAVETKLGIGASTPVANQVLLGNGTGSSTWGSLTAAYTSGSTGSGNFVLASSPTITSATLTTPTINNPTLNTDSVVGFTTSNTGTVYGVGITAGVITGANTVGTGTIVQNGVAASQLATNAITLGYAQITTGQTSTSSTGAQLTGLSTSVTIPSGGRRIKITIYSPGIFNSAASANYGINLWDGTVGSGTQLQAATFNNNTAASNAQNLVVPTTMVWVSNSAPAAGSKTYNVGGFTSSGTMTFSAGSSSPGFILVEVI